MLGFALVLTLAVPTAVTQNDLVVIAKPIRSQLTGPVVTNAALATMRGGLRLPNGLVVSLGIDIQTRIDGVLVLHSIYSSDGPNAGIRVFTDGTNSPRGVPSTTSVSTNSSPGIPLVIVSRSPTGPIVQAVAAAPGATVNLVNGDPATWANSAGQSAVPVIENGPAVEAVPGLISLRNDGSGAVVTLEAPSLQVRQLIGQSTGALVANTGNDRVIDTVSAVNVDVQGLSPSLMSAAFAVQRAVLDSRTR